MAMLVDADVAATCDAIRTLAIHEAWFCANTRSFCFATAKEDREKADAAFECLRTQLPFELANLLRKLAKHSSWHAANTRRFLLIDACRNEKIWNNCCAALRSKLAPDLAEVLELTFRHEAWHAANVRSFLWSDAAFDDQRFQEAIVRLQPLMQTQQTQEREDKLHSEIARKEKKGQQPCGSGCTSGCFVGGVLVKMLVDWWWTNSAEEKVTSKPLERPQPLVALMPESKIGKSFVGIQQTSPMVDSSLLPRSYSQTNLLSSTATAWQAVDLHPEGISAITFLVAASATAEIFARLGPLVSSVKSDIEGNIQKIRKNICHGDLSCRLEQMIEAEVAEAASLADAAKEGSTTLALLWLGRMLRLVARMALELDQHADKALSQCIQDGYDSCLSQHHPWAVRMTMSAAICGCPSRSSFYQKLGGQPNSALEADVRKLHEAMWPVLRHIQTLLVHKGVEKDDM